MNKMLVAVFQNENKAFEGLSALKELHKKGDITLYATAVLSKDEKGEVHLNSTADQGPIGTATGLFTGSLIGLIGGPVGLAIGAATGSIAGLIYDVSTDDLNTTFVDEVTYALTKGKTAVIAEIDETWTVPIDTKLEGLNAMVFRRLKDEIAEDQLARESEAIAAELRNLNEELKEAKERDKAHIEAVISKLQNKAETTNELVRKKLNETRTQLNAKIDTMEEQIKQAKDSRKAKIEKRIKDVKQEYSLRIQKLKQASKLIGEVLEPKEAVQKTARVDLP